MSMRERFSIELLAICAGIACVLALLIGSVWTGDRAAAAKPQLAQAAPTLIPAQTYEGIITDIRCGAKHSATINESAGDCTRTCVHAGEQFALIDGDQRYVLEGEPAALKRVAGERVQVVGALNGSTLSVTSVRGL
jgi:hypothetical protein